MLEKNIIVLFGIIIGLAVASFIYQPSYGHGLTAEILPPKNLGDRLVTLQAAVIPLENPEVNGRQLELSLSDSKTGEPIKAVTYNLKAKKNDRILFEHTFQEHDGTLILDLLPSESNQITREEQSEVSPFETMIGVKSKSVAKGEIFKAGGLYLFEVQILTGESYSNELEIPIKYDLGLSFPEISNYNFNDPNFGTHQLEFIAYYDQIKNFQYDPKSKAVSFELPFEWSENNIEQSAVVHNEILIPKAYSELMVSEFSAFVNDFELPKNSIQIDDFSGEKRLVHLIINQLDLNALFEKQKRGQDKMEFLLEPSKDSWLIGTVSENGQFRINLGWEPQRIESGSKVTLYFDILDIFLKNKSVSVNYDLSVIHGQDIIFSNSDTSSDSRVEHNEIEFYVPDNVTGLITIKLENLDENNLAKVEIPIVVNKKSQESSTNELENTSIPSWIRNNAKWWSEGTIGDSDFVLGIQYLIKEKILNVPKTELVETSNQEIPDWIKNNAGWWSQEMISDSDFIEGIQFLIKLGIIKV